MLLLLVSGQGEGDEQTNSRVNHYIEAAQAAELAREDGEVPLTDELIGAVVEAVRPDMARRGGVCRARADQGVAGAVQRFCATVFWSAMSLGVCR